MIQSDFLLPRAMMTARPFKVYICGDLMATTQAIVRDAPATTESKPTSQRLTSIDVFRGLAVAGMILTGLGLALASPGHYCDQCEP